MTLSLTLNAAGAEDMRAQIEDLYQQGNSLASRVEGLSNQALIEVLNNRLFAEGMKVRIEALVMCDVALETPEEQDDEEPVAKPAPLRVVGGEDDESDEAMPKALADHGAALGKIETLAGGEKRELLLRLAQKYEVKRFGEVPTSKGTELLADVLEIEAGG